MDPCAGDGAIIRAAACRQDVTWWGVEVREECAPALAPLLGERLMIQDFFTVTSPLLFDVILTNPPYSCAQEFIAASMECARQVVMLLRLNYLSSVRRSAFMRTYPPDVYILPNRPSFSPDGGTDSIEYAWFVWPGRTRRTHGSVRILATTPVHVRSGLLPNRQGQAISSP